MTNAEQQATLMREARLIPANQRVQVNPRLEPVSAIFVAQARNALPLPNATEMDAVLRLGNGAYAQVLEGLLDPTTAAISVTVALNEANVFTAPMHGGHIADHAHIRADLFLGIAPE